MHHETFNNTEQLSIAFPYTVFFLLLFSNKLLVFRAGIHKLLVRIANREDPIIRSSLIRVCTVCLGLSVQNFRSFTVRPEFFY